MKKLKALISFKLLIKIAIIAGCILAIYFLMSSEAIDDFVATPLQEATIMDLIYILLIADFLGVFKSSEK